jgi:hypothetical protein
VSRAVATFKRLSPAYKAVVALVAPIGTIIATLLALNVIQPFGEDAFAAGVDRTAEATTSAVNIRYRATPENAPAVEFAAAGEFDYRAGRGRLVYDFGGASAPGDVEVLFAGRDVYLGLGDGGDWVHANLDTAAEEVANYAELAGLDAPPPELASIEGLDFNDPSQVLAQLRGASAVEEVGEETIFGVATKGYRADVEGDQPIVATAWIDGSGLIRRLELASEKGAAPFTMTMELTEFGKPVDVEEPAPDKVRELADVLDAQLQ